MKSLLLAIILVLSVLIYPSEFKKIKIYINSPQVITLMGNKGIALEGIMYNRQESAVVMFANDYDLQIVKSLGLRYDVLNDNWIEYYKKVIQNTPLQKKVNEEKNRYGVTGFSLGSMGGFYTLDEIYAKLDSLHLKYGNLISARDSIGSTTENRAVYAVKVSGNPFVNQNKPGVLYTAMIHSDEPEGMMVLMYFINYLLENYNSDPAVKYLLDNRQLYFIPIINPDGYYFNQKEFPSGGGWWRKNRRKNNDSTYGVDLNRNFGPYEFWNSNNGGSSDASAADDFRGTEPFSEPETKAIKNFVLQNKIQVGLNYHTYGNLLIYPYGALSKETPDSLIFREYAQDLTSINNYDYGLDRELLYPTRGNTDDFMYAGDSTQRNKIFSMTPEVGDYTDGVDGNGFWPMPERIIPLAQENIYSNLYLAWIAGGYLKLNSFSAIPGYFGQDDSISLTLNLKNTGLLPVSNLKISLLPLNGNTDVSTNQVSLPQAPARTAINFEYPYKVLVSKTAASGEKLKLVLNIFSDNLLIEQDTLSFAAGKPVVLFSDSCNTDAGLWQYSGSSHWGISSESYHSSPACYTDSKGGNYLPNTTAIMVMKYPVDLSGVTKPVLSFWTKYSIEKSWDYGTVEISADSGFSWFPLKGNYSRLRLNEGVQLSASAYDGFQEDWVREEMDLSAYTGSKILIRFALNTSSQYPKDGWYIDDINISAYPATPAEVAGQSNVYNFRLEQNYPNPFNPVTTIKYTVGTRRGVFVNLTIYDLLGREVATLVNREQSPGDYRVEFNGSNLSSGFYIYRLTAGDYVSSKKMLIIR